MPKLCLQMFSSWEYIIKILVSFFRISLQVKLTNSELRLHLTNYQLYQYSYLFSKRVTIQSEVGNHFQGRRILNIFQVVEPQIQFVEFREKSKNAPQPKI